MLPRILRVSRAKRFLSNASRTKNNHPKSPAVTGTSGIYQPKLSSKSMSLSGRAKKLLGNAGAAQLSMSQRVRGSPRELDAGTSIPATKVVFEGHRASSKQDRGVLKLGGSGKKGGGKPRTRSSRRGAAFKASGRKKAGKS
jgi:nucleolar protein 12